MDYYSLPLRRISNLLAQMFMTAINPRAISRPSVIFYGQLSTKWIIRSSCLAALPHHYLQIWFPPVIRTYEQNCYWNSWTNYHRLQNICRWREVVVIVKDNIRSSKIYKESDSVKNVAPTVTQESQTYSTLLIFPY